MSVDEETQADYLVRYYILSLSSAFVERVYWWRLAARGYGLATVESDGSLRRRPAWYALRALRATLGDGRFIQQLPSPRGSWIYEFNTAEGMVLAGWSMENGVQAELPHPPIECSSRDGRELALPKGRSVSLGPSLQYFRLSGD